MGTKTDLPTTNATTDAELLSLEMCIQAVSKIQDNLAKSNADDPNIALYNSLKSSIEILRDIFLQETDEQKRKEQQKQINNIWDCIKIFLKVSQKQDLNASDYGIKEGHVGEDMRLFETASSELMNIFPSTEAKIKYVLLTIIISLVAIALISLLTAGIAAAVAVSIAGTLSMSAFIATFTGIGIALTTLPTAATAPSIAMLTGAAVAGTAVATTFGVVGTTKTLQKIGLFRDENYFISEVGESIKAIDETIPKPGVNS